MAAATSTRTKSPGASASTSSSGRRIGAPFSDSAQRSGGPCFERLLTFFLSRFSGRAFLCVLSGTLLFLACADFDIWPLCWIGMVPLLFVLLDADGMPAVRRPFLYGYLCGLFANGGGFYWIIGLLMRFGHMPWIAAAPIFALLIAYQALTFGIFATLLCRLRAQVDIPVTWLAALCWVACELCVPYVFPWYLAITQAWVPPVIQIADITGPLGVSFILVLGNAALFDLRSALLQRRARPKGRRREPLSQALRSPLFAAATIALCLVYGGIRIVQVRYARAHAPKIKIGVVQANIGIHEKFIPNLREDQLRIHQEQSRDLERRGADLIVWPESSYPYALPRPVVGDFPENDARQARRGLFRPLLFGALTFERSGTSVTPYNTAVFLDERGQTVGTFDKNFLLVFGEYIPFFEQMKWLRQMIPEMANFARGTTTTTFPLELHGHHYSIGPMICYEDIIPAFGRRLFAPSDSGAGPPNLLVNITNDAWFGATSEPYEHMALSVFRAVEHRVDLVRAVNTGVSAFIDATGRVYDMGPSVDPQLTPGVKPIALLDEAALMDAGGLYQRLGEAFGASCLAVVLLLGVLARRRAGRPVQWGWLLGGALCLHALAFLGALVLPGAGVDTFYAVLTRRNEAAHPEAQLFQATWQLAVLLAAGSAALGAVLASLGVRGIHRLRESTPNEGTTAPPAGRLEALWAIVCVTVLPVVLFGRMEGNTGGVVLLSLLCCCLSLLGAFITRLVIKTR